MVLWVNLSGSLILSSVLWTIDVIHVGFVLKAVFLLLRATPVKLK